MNRSLPSLKILARLLFNHMDAWGTTLIVATLALLLHNATNLQMLLLLLALTAGYWFAFAVNDYFDASADAADARKARRNVFVSHAPGRREMLLLTLPTFIFLFLAFAQFGRRGIVTLVLSLFIMWGYSAPPLRFKSRPGLDLLVHAFFVETFPYFVCLILIDAAWTRLDDVLLAILFLSSLAAQLEQQVRDYAVDAQTGRTFVTVLGRDRAVHLVRGITLALILLAAANILNGVIPPFVVVFGFIGLPALLHRFIRRRERPRSEKLVYASATTALLYTGVIFIYTILS